MRKALACAVAVAALSAATFAVPNAIAGTADGRGAQKRQLVQRAHTGPQQCAEGTPTSSNSARPNGFVIFNTNGMPGGQQTLIGQISLKSGTPNAIYTAFLQMVGSPANCQMPVGMLTTNGQGNGNLHFETMEMSPTGSYWIVLKQTPAGATEFATARALVD
ncbi:MAG: hypothetical protein ACRDJP_06345 [Actinomycetota bacterium]